MGNTGGIERRQSGGGVAAALAARNTIGSPSEGRIWLTNTLSELVEVVHSLIHACLRIWWEKVAAKELVLCVVHYKNARWSQG